jgi:cell division protein FtsL
MHYIQNNWFVMNWLWMIILCAIGVALVAYINNRTVLLKKSFVRNNYYEFNF